MSHGDAHRTASAVVRAEMPRPRVEMNLTPLIDVLRAEAAVERSKIAKAAKPDHEKIIRGLRG